MLQRFMIASDTRLVHAWLVTWSAAFSVSCCFVTSWFLDVWCFVLIWSYVYLLVCVSEMWLFSYVLFIYFFCGFVLGLSTYCMYVCVFVSVCLSVLYVCLCLPVSVCPVSIFQVFKAVVMVKKCLCGINKQSRESLKAVLWALRIESCISDNLYFLSTSFDAQIILPGIS